LRTLTVVIDGLFGQRFDVLADLQVRVEIVGLRCELNNAQPAAIELQPAGYKLSGELLELGVGLMKVER
jgi:hypothetical protein